MNIIERFKTTHNDKYDYSLVNYENVRTKVDIICKKHGVFSQLPLHHIKGQGCKKCVQYSNTIYEFYGDYWHGNPNIYNPKHINRNNKKSFGILYSETIYRENTLKSMGYNVISIWENDFIKKYKQK